MKRQSEIDQLIQTVANSASLLEPAAFDSICQFVRQSQVPNGAFCDRSGQPDDYYSLFGYLICKAFQLDQEIIRLRDYTQQKPAGKQTYISWSIATFFRHSFRPTLFSALTLSVQVVWRSIRTKDHTDQAYRAFITLLLLNQFWGSPRFLSGLASKMTHSLPVNDQLPTTHLAALLCINYRSNTQKKYFSSMLMSREHTDGGFIALSNQSSADLLSTATAAYALHRAQIDTRLTRPQHLHYVASLFSNGAFLSGDGDPTRDIEYTFYGLLSLGSFASFTEKER